MNRATSLTSSHLRVYENKSGDNIDDGLPSKIISQGDVLLELPMVECEFEIQEKTEGYIVQTKMNIISITSFGGNHLKLLFDSQKKECNDQFHEWVRCVQESKERSASNIPRVVEQRYNISSQGKSIDSQMPENPGRSPTTTTPSMYAAMLLAPISFANSESGSRRILITLSFYKTFVK